MKFNRESWIFVSGMAGYGKTWWILEHLRHLPKGSACILDYNRNDYQEFVKNQHVWNVQSGSQSEIEKFMNTIYKQGNMFTVFEEGDCYFSYPSEDIRKFVNTARNRGIGAFVSCKRAKSVQPVYRNRFTHLVLFRTSLPEDIRYLEQWVGIEKGGLDYLRNLQIGEHVVCDLITSTVSDIQEPI